MEHLSRRRFLKISAATFGAAAAATQWEPLARLARAADAPAGTVTVVPTFCEMCFWRCSGFAHVRDGKLWKFEGNPRDPQSRGRLCPRGTGAVGAYYDPDRLQKPLIRRGERGKEEWTAVTWDEAFTYIADRMNKIKAQYGPESVAVFNHGIGQLFIQHVLKSWGAINFAGSSFAQCRGPRDVGFALTFGTGLGSPEPTDIANTDCLVLIGAHLGENMHNTQVQEFAEAVERRIPIIVVDPRFSVAASKAKYWLPIRPGTDLALLLAWCNVLVTEGRYDRAFVEKYGHGFDKFAAEIKDNTPEWAAKETGIDAEMIRVTAREFANAPAGDPRPSGPARQLERRRHAAQPRDRAAFGAARQLGPQGRSLPRGRHEGRALSAAQAAEVRQADGRQSERREVSVRRRGHHHRHPRGDAHRQAVSDQGLVRLLDEPPLRAAEPGRDAEGDRRARPAGRHRHDAERDRRLRRRRAARGHVPRALRAAERRLRTPRLDVAAAAGDAGAARPEAELVDREGARRRSSASPNACRSRTSRSTFAIGSRNPG